MSRLHALVGTHPICNTMKFITTAGLDISQAFVARPTDVFLSTFPKSGTTWLQQICHQLRTGGHVDFTEISEESITPWLEVGPSLGIDIDAEHVANPRVFKSHQPLSQISHLDAKFLCVLRDPEDINDFARRGKWMEGGTGEYDEGDVEPTFGLRMWDFYTEFWRCREEPNVHIVTYEGMREDLAGLLPGIADFLGVEATEERYEKVLELSSFKWMKENEHLFNDNYVNTRLETLKGGEQEGGAEGEKLVPASKVGLKVADHINSTVSEETKQLLADIWSKKVTPITGHTTYEQMAASFS